jgi:hypothetical protein
MSPSRASSGQVESLRWIWGPSTTDLLRCREAHPPPKQLTQAQDWAASLPSRARRRSSAHISYIIRESVPWRKSANRMLRFVIRVVILWIGRSHPDAGAQGIAVTETPGACVELRLRVVLVCRNVNEERGRGLRVLRPLFQVTAHRLREWRYPVFYDFALSRGHLRSQKWHHGRHARGGTGK